MLSSDTVYVACVTDAFYVRHLGVTLCSLLENRSENYPVHFLVFANQIRSDDHNRLVALIERYQCAYTFLSINLDEYPELPTYEHLTQTTYYRTTLPDALEKHIPRVVFLDCDVIVKGDIRLLYNYPLNEKVIGAVENPGFSRYDQLNIPVGCGYFNAGVLLIDVVKWRQHEYGRKIMRFLTENASNGLLEAGDQDAFNALLCDQWKPLPTKWNVQRQMFKDPQTYPGAANPAIVHYTSSRKPWDYLNDHPYKNEYFRYLKCTPWKNKRVIPKDFTAKNMTKKILRSLGVAPYQRKYW
jgi:lipopolysaccharide biosynthesis glycosyltransferase